MMEHFNNLGTEVQQKAIEILAYELLESWWQNNVDGTEGEYYAEEVLMRTLEGEKGFDHYYQEWAKEQDHAK